MKRLLVSLSLATLSLLAVASCKKADAVTPIDPIPGEYVLSGTASFTVEGVVSTSPASGTLSVYAGNTPGTYYFLERYGSTELGYLTNNTNGNFTVQGVPDYAYFNDVRYFGYQNGGGTIGGNVIKYDRYAVTNTPTYIAPTNGTTYATKNIRKHMSLTARK